MQTLLTVTVPATQTMLATVDDLKAELDLTTNDNSRLFRYLRAASQQIGQYLNRTLALETVSETFRRDVWPAGWSPANQSRSPACLNLDRYPVTTITSVTMDGLLLDPATDYECDKPAGQLFRLYSDQRCHWSACKIVVVYQGGYVLAPASGANLPADIETAAIRLAAQSYQSRERETGLRSEIIPGVMERQYWDETASGQQSATLAPDLQALLDPYRRVVIV